MAGFKRKGDFMISPQPWEEEHYIDLWKKYPDELLDKAQRLIESDLGYNGVDMAGLVWVPIYEGTNKEDKLHLPKLRDGLIHAIILAVANREKLLTTKLELLERVEKEVIGEDEESTSEAQDAMNDLRYKQRAKLTTIRKEL